ncbi:hypothetical protein N9Z87_01760 [Amylibacter sp.]|nr:hypothetical protein [Amylibacter sp.]
MTKRIVMLVSNPCNPDYRVTKEAESLAKAGYSVYILATWSPKLGIPINEIINGVTYLRYEWNVLKILRMQFLGERPYREIPKLSRDGHFEILESLKDKKQGKKE